MENGGVKGAWSLDRNLLIWEMKARRASLPRSRRRKINNWVLCGVTCPAAGYVQLRVLGCQACSPLLCARASRLSECFWHWLRKSGPNFILLSAARWQGDTGGSGGNGMASAGKQTRTQHQRGFFFLTISCVKVFLLLKPVAVCRVSRLKLLMSYFCKVLTGCPFELARLSKRELLRTSNSKYSRSRLAGVWLLLRKRGQSLH